MAIRGESVPVEGVVDAEVEVERGLGGMEEGPGGEECRGGYGGAP